MNESYHEVREQLRKQHAMNKNEVHGKNIPCHYGIYTTDASEYEDAYMRSLLFKGKIILFLCCVMLFSCYLYGGQDVKKGADLAVDELRNTVLELEKTEPIVKEAMYYCRQGYHWVKDTAKDYLENE